MRRDPVFAGKRFSFSVVRQKAFFILSYTMKNLRGLSFITLMIAIAIFSLLLRIAIEKIIKINIAQNESNASETLKLISTALENYAANNQGGFPLSISVLTQTTPAKYLDKNYINESPLKGYSYSCSRLEASGYSCSAVPLKCGLSGRMVYAITTGGSLAADACEKEE